MYGSISFVTRAVSSKDRSVWLIQAKKESKVKHQMKVGCLFHSLNEADQNEVVSKGETTIEKQRVTCTSVSSPFVFKTSDVAND